MFGNVRKCLVSRGEQASSIQKSRPPFDVLSIKSLAVQCLHSRDHMQGKVNRTLKSRQSVTKSVVAMTARRKVTHHLIQVKWIPEGETDPSANLTRALLIQNYSPLMKYLLETACV